MQDQHKRTDVEMTASSQTGHLVATDAGEFAEMHRPTWRLGFEQLSCGPFLARKEFRRSGNALVYHESYSRTVRGVGEPTPGVFILAVINSAGKQGRWWGRSFPESALPMVSDDRGADHWCVGRDLRVARGLDRLWPEARRLDDVRAVVAMGPYSGRTRVHHAEPTLQIQEAELHL